MSFFDQNLSDDMEEKDIEDESSLEEENSGNSFIDISDEKDIEELHSKDQDQNSSSFDDVNQSNQHQFDQIMDNASVHTDDYWDKNNPILKFILIILGIFIFFGVVYFAYQYYSKLR